MDNNLGLTKFKHLRAFWCQKVIPLVYDESLSYYEMLCKLMHRINQLIDAINEIIDILEDHETRITSLETWREIIDAWKTLIDNWKSEMDAWKGTVDDKLESIEDDIEGIEQDIVGLGQDIANVQNDITDLYQTKQDILIAGDNITIEDNVISASGELELLPATASRLGGVKIGEGVTVDEDGTISVEGGSYELPTMSSTVKGGARLGEGLVITDTDVLDVDVDNLDLSSNESITSIQNDITEIQGDISNIEGDITTIQGDITEIEGDITNIESNITTIQGDITEIEGDITNIVDGTTEIDISENTTIENIVSGDTPIQLPIASANSLGAIKVGSGLSIDALTGILSATGGGEITPSFKEISVTLVDTYDSSNTITGYLDIWRMGALGWFNFLPNNVPEIETSRQYKVNIPLANLSPVFSNDDISKQGTQFDKNCLNVPAGLYEITSIFKCYLLKFPNDNYIQLYFEFGPDTSGTNVSTGSRLFNII